MPPSLRSPRRAPPLVLLTCAALAAPALATAQSSGAPALEVRWPTGERDPDAAIVAYNADDDDDDGVPDALAQPLPALATDDEQVEVSIATAGRGPVRLTVRGHVRLINAAGALVDRLELPASRTPVTARLTGTAPSASANDAELTVQTEGAPARRVALTVVGAAWLRGDNAIVWPHRDAVGVSHEITNNETLPRLASWDERSTDPDNLRAEVWDPGAVRGVATTARVESLGTGGSVGITPGAARGAIAELELARPSAQVPLRSRFVRLVGDDMDLRAPGVQGQVLLVGLRDRVHLRYRRAGVAGDATSDVRVGRPGNEDGPLAARRARWHLVVMRDRAGGRPMIGGDDAGAVRIAREQVAISNEVYLQCSMTFGEPATYPVVIADPPEGSLIAVADDDGLLAVGGVVRLRVGGRALAPVRVERGWRPIQTAEAIAAAVRAAGYVAHATVNRRTDYGADGSADVVVRDARDRLVEVSPVPNAPLSTDPQQSVTIGRVDFTDGLDEFNNLNSSSGTLEERTLLKSLIDDDPATIELVVINRFTHQTRIGEAFVEGDGGAILNALILDRVGISAQREAWTQSHEAGHIFLNQPWHPDNMGPDRPWLLMDADASLGAVTGPKRLTSEECRRLHAESGLDATPALLTRYDPARPSPRAPQYAQWPGSEPYPRALPAVVSNAPLRATRRASRPDVPAATWGLSID